MKIIWQYYNKTQSHKYHNSQKPFKHNKLQIKIRLIFWLMIKKLLKISKVILKLKDSL